MIKNFKTQSFKPEDTLNNPIFKLISSIDRNKMLQDLNKFEIEPNNQEESITRIKKFSDKVKNQNLILESRLNKFRNKINNPINLDGEINHTAIKEASLSILENKEYKIEVLNKPFGKFKFGDITFKEAYNKGVEVIKSIVEYTKNKNYDLYYYMSLIPALFAFKEAVKLFDYVSFSEKPNFKSSQDELNFTLLRSRQIRVFMVYYAPVIAGSFYLAEKFIGGPSIIYYYGSPETISSSILFFGKYKIPDWLKQFIYFGISLYIFNLIQAKLNRSGDDAITSLILSNLVIFKWIVIIASILSIIQVLYNIICIYLYIMFSKNKINIPIHLPLSIINWLNFIKNISKSEDKGIFIELFFRQILIYIVVFLIFMFTLYLISANFDV